MPHEAPFWIALSSLPGVGPATFRALCERFGGPENVFAAESKELIRTPGLRHETRIALRQGDSYVRSAQRTAKELSRQRISVITADDPAYPACLFDLRDPPPVLYVLGVLPELRRAFSVAGSTRPSARGAEIAHAAGGELAQAGRTVGRGYAQGIDTAAHLGALEAGGRTVLVLPTGIRTFELRPEFERFRSQVGEAMVLLSERPPDDTWASRGAVLRDRIIAALGRALLVVEARPDSGTMITLRHALGLRRPAYVVKYRRAPPGASGNSRDIRAGGVPVESIAAFRQVIRAAQLPAAAPKGGQGELF